LGGPRAWGPGLAVFVVRPPCLPPRPPKALPDPSDPAPSAPAPRRPPATPFHPPQKVTASLLKGCKAQFKGAPISSTVAYLRQ
jgi:hypothetical protein